MIIYVKKLAEFCEDGRNKLVVFTDTPKSWSDGTRFGELHFVERCDGDMKWPEADTYEYLMSIPEIAEMKWSDMPVRLNFEKKVVMSHSDVDIDWKNDDEVEKRQDERREEIRKKIVELRKELDGLMKKNQTI